MDDEDVGGICGIRNPHTFDNCLRHEHSTSDDLRPSPAELLSMATNPSAEPLLTYVIKANGLPVNVFSDEEFVESCSEPEIETAKADNNDCRRVSNMFNKLVGFLLDVEQYLYESENVTKAQLLKKVTSTRKMLKRNSDLFFDMADFLTSKSGSSGMTNEKQSNDEFISHNLVSVFTEASNTKDQVETRKSSSSSKVKPSKIPKRNKKRCPKKRPSTSGHKQDSEKPPVDNSSNNNNSNNSNKENDIAREDGFVGDRRRSTRPRARRSVYFNGEKMHLNSDGELIPLSSGQTAEQNQTKTRKRKSTETTPVIKKLNDRNSSHDGSIKRQLYSPDVWLKHINDTGINY